MVKAILKALQTAQIQTFTSLQSHCRQPPEGTGMCVRKEAREDRGCGKYNSLTPTQRSHPPCALIFPRRPITECPPLSCCYICLNQWLFHGPSGPQKHLAGCSGLSLKGSFWSRFDMCQEGYNCVKKSGPKVFAIVLSSIV